MNHDYPLLPLDLWRAEMGFNPWHFWGMTNTTAPVSSIAAGLVREHSWQNADASGREDIRKAIHTAETLWFGHARFWPAPVYSEDILPWPRLSDQRQMRIGRMDPRYGWAPVLLREGKIRNVGVETLTAIQVGAAVAYADHDSDGLKEDFVLTAATTVTDINEIAVYFSAADRLYEDSALSERWRVEPVTVAISGGTVTIKGKRWLLAKPVLYESAAAIDPGVDANFVTTLDIYRRYTYRDGTTAANSQASLIWESRPSYDGSGVTSATDPSSIGIVAARVGVRNSEAGIITPAEALYNTTTSQWYHPTPVTFETNEPDRVQVRYLAGEDLDERGWMQPWARTAIARLAAAELQRSICGAEVANRSLSYWQFDVSRVRGTEEYQISLNSLDNPFGTRRGHIYAWQQMMDRARTVGHLA